MVMFAESKAQQIAENGLLPIDEKIAQLLEFEARPDASGSNPRWLMRSVRRNASSVPAFCLRRAAEAFRRFTGPISKKRRDCSV